MLSVVYAFVTRIQEGLFTIPFVIHRNPALKIFGATACFLALSLTVLIGLGISHYRDALSVDAENPAQMALVNLQASPLALNDIMSWGLLGMSIIAAISALIDGLSLSDRYPFYGSKHKRYAEAKLEFDNELSELREELKNLKDSSLKQLDEDIAQAQRLLSQQESLIQSKDASMRRLSTALADAEHCMHSLLALFRQENRLHRKGLPPPATFASMPELKELPPPDFDVAADRRALETQQRATDELTARLQAIRASIQTAFNREFDKLKPLGTQLQYAPMPSTAEVAV